LALWSFVHEMSYVVAQVLVLQSVSIWLFPLAIVITSFGDVTELFICLFSLKKNGSLFA
jgi:hypothetical protein